MKAQRALLTVAAGAVLIGLRPDFGALGSRLTAPQIWLGEAGVDSAVAEIARTGLWLTALWVAFGLLALVVAQLPGPGGRLGRAAARRVLPAVVLRIAVGATGAAAVLGPTTAALAQPAPAQVAISADAPAPTVVARPGVRPAGEVPWPVDPSPSSTPAAAVSTPAPLSGVPAPASGAAAPASSTPGPPTLGVGPVWPVTSAAPAAPTMPVDTTVRVRSGDSLWMIAASRLRAHASDAEIAASWPRWYQANRRVIGSDPSFIRPGQLLRVPAGDTARDGRPPS